MLSVKLSCDKNSKCVENTNKEMKKKVGKEGRGKYVHKKTREKRKVTAREIHS